MTFLITSCYSNIRLNSSVFPRNSDLALFMLHEVYGVTTSRTLWLELHWVMTENYYRNKPVRTEGEIYFLKCWILFLHPYFSTWTRTEGIWISKFEKRLVLWYSYLLIIYRLMHNFKYNILQQIPFSVPKNSKEF